MAGQGQLRGSVSSTDIKPRGQADRSRCMVITRHGSDVSQGLSSRLGFPHEGRQVCLHLQIYLSTLL